MYIIEQQRCLLQYQTITQSNIFSKPTNPATPGIKLSALIYTNTSRIFRFHYTSNPLRSRSPNFPEISKEARSVRCTRAMQSRWEDRVRPGSIEKGGCTLHHWLALPRGSAVSATLASFSNSSEPSRNAPDESTGLFSAKSNPTDYSRSIMRDCCRGTRGLLQISFYGVDAWSAQMNYEVSEKRHTGLQKKITMSILVFLHW